MTKQEFVSQTRKEEAFEVKVLLKNKYKSVLRGTFLGFNHQDSQFATFRYNRAIRNGKCCTEFGGALTVMTAKKYDRDIETFSVPVSIIQTVKPL